MGTPKNNYLSDDKNLIASKYLTHPGKYTHIELKVSCIGDTGPADPMREHVYAVHNRIENKTHSYHRTQYEAEVEQASVIRKYKQLEASGWPVSAFKAIW